MSHYKIETCRLKTIRTARKLGRPKLAKLVGMSERELATLERTKGGGVVPEQVLFRFADVLNIPAPILTGDLDFDASDLGPVQATSCTSGCCG